MAALVYVSRSLLLLVAILAASCAQETGVATGQASTYRLTWVAEGGRAELTEYFLDGQGLGRGTSGLAALRNRIDKMPRGSKVVIGHYISGEDGRTYPFDLAEFRGWTDARGVMLLVPSAR